MTNLSWLTGLLVRTATNCFENPNIIWYIPGAWGSSSVCILIFLIIGQAYRASQVMSVINYSPFAMHEWEHRAPWFGYRMNVKCGDNVFVVPFDYKVHAQLLCTSQDGAFSERLGCNFIYQGKLLFIE